MTILSWHCSGSVIITDPCYTRDLIPNLGGFLDVKEGKWYVTAVCENDVIVNLYTYHNNLKNLNRYKSEAGQLFPKYAWEKAYFEASVNSGKICIVDNYVYPEGETGDYRDPTSFYGKCCEISKSCVWDIINANNGVCGNADDNYNCFVHTNSDNEIDGIELRTTKVENNKDDEEDDE